MDLGFLCRTNRDKTLAQTNWKPFSLLWTQQHPAEPSGSATAPFHPGNRSRSSTQYEQCMSDGCGRRCGPPANDSDGSYVHVHADVIMIETSGLPPQHTGEDWGSDWYPVSCWSQHTAPFSPQCYHFCPQVRHMESPKDQPVNLYIKKSSLFIPH